MNLNNPTENKTRKNADSQNIIDKVEAKEIARLFLHQLHSTVIFKEAVLHANVWTVTMDVGLIGRHLIDVKIDAYSGKILGYV